MHQFGLWNLLKIKSKFHMGVGFNLQMRERKKKIQNPKTQKLDVVWFGVGFNLLFWPQKLDVVHINYGVFFSFWGERNREVCIFLFLKLNKKTEMITEHTKIYSNTTPSYFTVHLYCYIFFSSFTCKALSHMQTLYPLPATPLQLRSVPPAPTSLPWSHRRPWHHSLDFNRDISLTVFSLRSVL